MDKFKLIQEAILKDISLGKLKKGQKLMSVRQGARHFDASPATVLKAYEALVRRHVIFNQARKGYFVMDESGPKAAVHHVDFASLEASATLLPQGDFNQCVTAALKTYGHALYKEAPVLGLDPLRKALSHHLRDNQVFSKSETIVVTSGAQQAMDILFKMAYPNGGDTLLFESPTYDQAIRAAQANKQKIAFVKRNHQGLDFGHLETLFKSGTIKCFFVMPRYHNPLATSLSLKDRQALYELACRYNVYLIEDDYLVDLDNCNKLPTIKHFDEDDRVVYLKSFSKVLMPGLRVAALVLPLRLMEAFTAYKTSVDAGTNTLSQAILEVYIRSGMLGEHVILAGRAYRERADLLHQLFSQHGDKNMSLHMASGGVIASLGLPRAIAHEKLQRSLAVQGIKIGGGNEGYLNQVIHSPHLRLSLMQVSLEEIEKYFPLVLKALSQALDQPE